MFRRQTVTLSASLVSAALLGLRPHYSLRAPTVATAFAAAPHLFAAARRINTAGDAPRINKLTNTSEYHNVSEQFIEECSIMADTLLDTFPVFDDTNYADGVLEIKAPGVGTFVLNKQAPLHQVWYSSPLSGPHHYDYNADTKRWVSDKDRHDLQDKLERELSQVCGKKITMQKPTGQ
jgi:frataxin